MTAELARENLAWVVALKRDGLLRASVVAQMMRSPLYSGKNPILLLLRPALNAGSFPLISCGTYTGNFIGS